MTQTPVRFAILGFGHHAVRRLLPAFAKCEFATLTGMWRRDQAAAVKNCAEHGIVHCFPSREALCSSHDIDVVFITSPDAMHKDDMMLALQHGKAVLCEKPLAMNAADAQEMADAANRAGLLFGVGHMDAMTFATAVPMIALVAGAACFLPAWRASRLDPNVVLRWE